MTRTTLTMILLLVLLPLFASCASAGPSPADVEADRARWTAVRAVVADGQIDAAEATSLVGLLAAWDAKIAVGEAGSKQDRRGQLEELVRVYGAAVVSVTLGPELQRRAPDLFRLVDRNTDGQLAIDEILSIDPASPVFAVVVATTVAQLVRR